VNIVSSAFSSSCVNVFSVNLFFSAVTAMIPLSLLILLISRSVAAGFGRFCRRVMAKMVWNVLFLKGVWSASARMTAMLWYCFACVFAFLIKPSEVSSPMRSFAEFLMCLKSMPVPHPMSSMTLSG